MRKRNVILLIFFIFLIIGSILFGVILFINNIVQNRSPSARYGHAMVYDPIIQKVILFGGGYDDSITEEYYDDTWIYDCKNNIWRELNPTDSPSTRSGHNLVYDQVNQKVILFGGYDPNVGFLNDTWIFDSQTNQWYEVIPENSPSNRSSSSIYYDPDSQRIILFGGYSENVYHLDDMWVYDYLNNTWTEIYPSIKPEGLYGQEMVYIPSIQRGILFGGRGSMIMDDTWTYNNTNNSWIEMNTINEPENRYWHGMIFDSTAQKIIIFGGRDNLSPGDSRFDTWLFHFQNNTWTEVFPENYPSRRMLFSMVYDIENQKTILFGGYRFQGITLGDTWIYDYNTNNWRLVKGF